LTRFITSRGIRSVFLVRFPRGFLAPLTSTPGSSANIRWIVSVEYCHSEAICATVKVSCFPSSAKGSFFVAFLFLSRGAGSVSSVCAPTAPDRRAPRRRFTSRCLPAMRYAPSVRNVQSANSNGGDPLLLQADCRGAVAGKAASCDTTDVAELPRVQKQLCGTARGARRGNPNVFSGRRVILIDGTRRAVSTLRTRQEFTAYCLGMPANAIRAKTCDHT
jgi:hypothetical protein